MQVLPPDEVLQRLGRPVQDLRGFHPDQDPLRPAPSPSCACATSLICWRLTQSAISHQLRVLRSSKLVKFRRDGKTLVSIPWPTSTSAASSARGWNTWKSERWLSFIADHVCLCPGRRGGPPGGGGGDRRASLLRLSGGGGASLQPCSVPSSCIPVDSVVMRP